LLVSPADQAGPATANEANRPAVTNAVACFIVSSNTWTVRQRTRVPVPGVRDSFDGVDRTAFACDALVTCA
jgi:hypothetical protein